MRIEWLDECVSTNTQVTEYPLSEEGVIVAVRCQTGGRGQKGNSWEAQPGKNLTFSAMWKPRGIAAREQFSISEAVALAVVDFLEDAGINAKVKWPNDIYVDDRKICGILIEHSVMGTEISRTIAGVGINVNQREFLSGAPNPVSMASIAGTEFPTERLLEDFEMKLRRRLSQISGSEGRIMIHDEFQSRMWRFDGSAYPFRIRESGESYPGIVRGVEPMGFLHVENADTGETCRYAFKEVEFLLSGGI